MKISYLVAGVVVSCWAWGVQAAPATKNKPVQIAKSTAAPATAAAPAKEGGVYINALTRNAAESKIAFPLAKGGQALAPIIISENASARTKLAAGELQKFLSQMSGANFELKTGDGETGIVVGTITEFPIPALDKALEIRHSIDGKEAYAIRTREKRVVLLGATDKGTSHAVYRFLQELGCRWFFNSDNWEVIPSVSDLKFNRDITDRPAFLYRDIWYAWYFFNDAGHPKSTPEKPRNAGSDHGDWLRRNEMGGSFTANTGHAYEAIARENAKEFEAHPEYWALVGGKRQGGQFELGNPGLRKLVCDYAVNFFKKNPDADMVSVDPADGGGMSESDEAKAYCANPSDAAFKLANEVAVALQKAYPGQNKMVGLYAYNWHSDPPPFALEPNVYIQLTMGFNGGKLTLDQLFEEWPKKARNLGFYDYYSTWRWDYDMWPGGRIGSKNYPIEMIGRFQKANRASGAYATSISAESSNNWGVSGRGYYLASKMMWNPDTDVEATLQDFYDKAFGPASAAMKEYYDLQDNVPPMSPGVVGALFRRLKVARDAAKNDPAVMRRLDDIANYLHYYDWNYRLGRETDAAKRTAMTLDIQTYMYRQRYSYMNHWEAFRQDSIHDTGAADFPRPWKIDTPITHDETEAWFQDGLAHYPELKIPQLVNFSKDLIPVTFGGEKKEYVSPMIQGGSQEFALYSLHGEPIEAKLYSFAMYGGPKQAYELRASNGKVLAEGKPQGTEKGTLTDLNVEVPGPGRYTLKYTDGSGSLYELHVPATQPIGLQLDKLNGSTSLYKTTPDLYFYVPKGVKSIEYYFARTPWSNSGPHDVIDPEGAIRATFLDKNGDYLSVPVPEGMDGKVWRFGSPKNSSQGFGLGYFHFFNIPDVLSPSPALMLLPKDLVQKDGLKIVK